MPAAGATGCGWRWRCWRRKKKWGALLGESPSWRTNQIREVRHKTLQVAQKRVETVLKRMTPKDEPGIADELAAALDRLGL